MFDRFQGDPKLILTEEGVDISYEGGQPVMDQGLENAAIMSLFVDGAWWGNDLFTDVNQHLGSDFEEATRGSITISSLVKIQKAGEKALGWMIDTGVAKSTTVVAKNTNGNQIEVEVTIEPPSRDTQVLLAEKHGANWVAQKDYPAHERV